MQCRIICLFRWPIFPSFFEFQQNPCHFYLDTCVFQFALFLIDYLLPQTLLSLASTFSQLKFFWCCLVLSCSFSNNLLWVSRGFLARLVSLAKASAVLISKSEAILTQLMFSTHSVAPHRCKHQAHNSTIWRRNLSYISTQCQIPLKGH